ncbi:MAG: glutamyl-tRNA reductase [Archaeoglobaceae archaeon]|nr:glutamyl-tRNA reductase [Archaeoglobaceae archaeon]MDW7989350.1 glutamyl-tRNA reductase [Archaeoglobaceae archaeon]
MEFGCLSLSHKKSRIEEIERVVKNPNLNLILKSCSFNEFVYIITCNRFEIYVYGDLVKERLEKLARDLDVENAEIFYAEDCLRHLMRVCSGIESMIVGENEILGQVKRSLRKCEEAGIAGENLKRIFLKAIQVGSKVRKETGISKRALSIGSAAVELAEKVLGSLKGKKVLVVGAGEMGKLVARAMRRDVETIFIANRTFSKAEVLAKKLNGIAVKFDRLTEFLKICDVVISATSAPHVVITKEVVEKVMKDRDKKLVIIDIALPRDVEDSVRSISNVKLFTIDDLREISEENLKNRLFEVKKAEEIIERELNQFRVYVRELKANKAIDAMYSLAGRFVYEEIEELCKKLEKFGIDGNVRPLLKAFAISLIKKFLSEPTTKLKIAARNGNFELINAVAEIFGGKNVSKSEDEKIKKGEFEKSISRVEAQH